MLLIIHVGIALSSLGYAAYLYIRPSVLGLAITYSLIALTLLTGFSLVFEKPESLPQVCTSGLLYLALMLAGVVLVHRKLRSIYIEHVEK